MTLQRTPEPEEAHRIVRAWQAEGLSVGFVPTMGALHEGHLSLVDASVRGCDRTVVSIYVNPTQFGPGEDLKEYPRRLERDCQVAEQRGVDLVFNPGDEQMYPDGFCTYVVQEGLAQVLEGEFRPTHFRGVLTVVCKLLHIIPADRAHFGRKDFQQTVVVRRMARDLDMDVDIRVMPTIREEDGLAVSSRNEYLDAGERQSAVCLYEALMEAKRRHAEGDTDAARLRLAMNRIIGETPLVRPDYVEIVDRETLQPVETVTDRAVAVLAVHVGETRLIDNMPFSETG